MESEGLMDQWKRITELLLWAAYKSRFVQQLRLMLNNIYSVTILLQAEWEDICKYAENCVLRSVWGIIIKLFPTQAASKGLSTPPPHLKPLTPN